MKDRGAIPRQGLIIFLALGALLLLPNLGSRLYWGDEREDFNFIWRILEYGVPYMKDGHTDGTPQVTENHLHVYHPWLYLYSNTLSVKLFGWDNRFMFRLSGVLWALVSIAAVWRLARCLNQEGLWATALYTLSPFMLVPARLSRYYGAVMALSPLVVYFYLQVRNKRKEAPWLLAFFLSILFHHNTMAAVALGCGCLLHWIFSGFHQARSYILSPALAAVPILGWIFGMELLGQGRWIDLSLVPSQSLKGFWILLASTLPLPVLVWAVWQRKNLKDFLILFGCFLIPLLFLISGSVYVTPNVRYFLPIICLSFCLLGFLLESLPKVWKWGVFFVFVFSNLLNLLPLSVVHLLPTEKLANYGRSGEDAQRFFTATAAPRFLLLGHLSEIFGTYEGPGEALVTMLKKSGYKAGETLGIYWPEGEEHNRYMRCLTQATFELNDGKPGEMLRHLFTDPLAAQWIVVFEREVPESISKRTVVATESHSVGFWVDGPNPFNRRWKTQQKGQLTLLKRLHE